MPKAGRRFRPTLDSLETRLALSSAGAATAEVAPLRATSRVKIVASGLITDTAGTTRGLVTVSYNASRGMLIVELTAKKLPGITGFRVIQSSSGVNGPLDDVLVEGTFIRVRGKGSNNYVAKYNLSSGVDAAAVVDRLGDDTISSVVLTSETQSAPYGSLRGFLSPGRGSGSSIPSSTTYYVNIWNDSRQNLSIQVDGSPVTIQATRTILRSSRNPTILIALVGPGKPSVNADTSTSDKAAPLYRIINGTSINRQ